GCAFLKWRSKLLRLKQRRFVGILSTEWSCHEEQIKIFVCLFLLKCPVLILCASYLSFFTLNTCPDFVFLCPLQVSNRLYHNTDKSKSSKYSLSAQSHRQKTTLSFFPKPVYSYSILIFMALKNSKTGSLPVSEIYSFMTEHFPYFKTAPDGWKNSVRHNLSLNKCFVKMENKNGTSSRKGCLWALNPARIAKMQEECLQWRRSAGLQAENACWTKTQLVIKAGGIGQQLGENHPQCVFID
uniref:Fork-head domain-containing protein n=1 Tax=Mola mola TaxID=94237 RepID=A0A3Q3WEF6_MOLML